MKWNIILKVTIVMLFRPTCVSYRPTPNSCNFPVVLWTSTMHSNFFICSFSPALKIKSSVRILNDEVVFMILPRKSYATNLWCLQHIDSSLFFTNVACVTSSQVCNAVPTPFLPRLCLLVHIICILHNICNTNVKMRSRT